MNYRLPIRDRSGSPMTRTFGDELAMELLTRLSPQPQPVRDMCADMEIGGEDFEIIVKILNQNNFGVVLGKVKGVRCVWISEATWAHANKVATAYYERVERAI